MRFDLIASRPSVDSLLVAHTRARSCVRLQINAGIDLTPLHGREGGIYEA